MTRARAPSSVCRYLSGSLRARFEYLCLVLVLFVPCARSEQERVTTQPTVQSAGHPTPKLQRSYMATGRTPLHSSRSNCIDIISSKQQPGERRSPVTAAAAQAERQTMIGDDHLQVIPVTTPPGLPRQLLSQQP